MVAREASAGLPFKISIREAAAVNSGGRVIVRERKTGAAACGRSGCNGNKQGVRGGFSAYFFNAESSLLSRRIWPISSLMTSSRRLRPMFSGTISRMPR